MIPAFDHNHVLPPHLGDPRSRGQISPYLTTPVELVERFATTDQRIKLLTGLFSFRVKISELGLTDGFQWLDGSFVEHIEAQEQRAPNDIDMVTFLRSVSADAAQAVSRDFPQFLDRKALRAQYYLDHYTVELGHGGMDAALQSVTYWTQLFGHTRNGVWKGMLALPLDRLAADKEALQLLNEMEL